MNLSALDESQMRQAVREAYSILSAVPNSTSAQDAIDIVESYVPSGVLQCFSKAIQRQTREDPEGFNGLFHVIRIISRGYSEMGDGEGAPTPSEQRAMQSLFAALALLILTFSTATIRQVIAPIIALSEEMAQALESALLSTLDGGAADEAMLTSALAQYKLWRSKCQQQSQS